MVGVIHHDSALQGAQMVVVGVLVEGEEDVRFVTGAEDFARANPDLENRWAARDGRRDRHEGHDLLFASASEAGQEARRSRLNSILEESPAIRMTASCTGHLGRCVAGGRRGDNWIAHGKCCVCVNPPATGESRASRHAALSSIAQ